jgi:L-lactate dehydrogenase (cytochrome)
MAGVAGGLQALQRGSRDRHIGAGILAAGQGRHAIQPMRDAISRNMGMLGITRLSELDSSFLAERS